MRINICNSTGVNFLISLLEFYLLLCRSLVRRVVESVKEDRPNKKVFCANSASFRASTNMEEKRELEFIKDNLQELVQMKRPPTCECFDMTKETS